MDFCAFFLFPSCLLLDPWLFAADGGRQGFPAPCPEDKEIRAKNRARNEEQKKAKEDKKAKATQKAQRREISAKNH